MCAARLAQTSPSSFSTPSGRKPSSTPRMPRRSLPSLPTTTALPRSKRAQRRAGPTGHGLGAKGALLCQGKLEHWSLSWRADSVDAAERVESGCGCGGAKGEPGEDDTSRGLAGRPDCQAWRQLSRGVCCCAVHAAHGGAVAHRLENVDGVGVPQEDDEAVRVWAQLVRRAWTSWLRGASSTSRGGRWQVWLRACLQTGHNNVPAWHPSACC